MTFNRVIFIYALFAGLGWSFHEIYKDYCFEQQRELTDKEYLAVAFNFFRDRHMKVHDWDSTIDSYLSHHPKCCWISKEYGILSPLTTEITARIFYELTDEAKTTVGGGKYTHYDGIINISTCGDPYYPTGEPMPTPTPDFNQQSIN